MSPVKIRDINLVPFTDKDLDRIYKYLENRQSDIVKTMLSDDKRKALTLDEYDALHDEYETVSDLKALFVNASFILV